jgi:hypothetical protein
MRQIALICALLTAHWGSRVSDRSAVHVRDAAHKATTQRDDGWRHRAVPIGRRASAGKAAR